MRADIVAALGEFDAAQVNGEPPATLVAGRGWAKAVAVSCHRFYSGMHFRATPRHHCICFQMSQARVELRMAAQVVRDEPPAGC